MAINLQILAEAYANLFQMRAANSYFSCFFSVLPGCPSQLWVNNLNFTFAEWCWKHMLTDFPQNSSGCRSLVTSIPKGQTISASTNCHVLSPVSIISRQIIPSSALFIRIFRVINFHPIFESLKMIDSIHLKSNLIPSFRYFLILQIWESKSERGHKLINFPLLLPLYKHFHIIFLREIPTYDN